MERVRCITVNTDASFDHQTLASGYAFYIVSDVMKIHKKGNFTHSKPQSALEAEIMAIGNALYCLLVSAATPEANNLVINTDCTEAIRHITDGQTPIAMSVLQIYNQLKERLGCKKSSFRHVKAHSKLDSKRKGANNWCDIAARDEMRKQRKRILNQPK